MKFDKGRRQIVVFLVVYLLISAMVFLTSFPYLSFKTLSETAELRLYSLFSIVAASFVFFYTKRMFKHASSFEKTVVTQNDTERREEERREQERINAENRKRKAEAEKKELTEKVAEISSGLDGESPEKYFDQLLINMSKCLDIVQGVAYALRSTDSKYFMEAHTLITPSRPTALLRSEKAFPVRWQKTRKFFLWTTFRRITSELFQAWATARRGI